MTTAQATTVTPIQFCDIPNFLPPIGSPLQGGIFAGVSTTKAGTYVAVVLLPGEASFNWRDAQAWAAEQGGELPTRLVAALLYTTLKGEFKPEWYWTSEEHSAPYAWLCNFLGGYQGNDRKSYEGCVRAVRLIPLIA